MNVDVWLKNSVKKLESAGIGTARLDPLVLLEDVLNVDRAKLLAEPELEILSSQAAELAKLLKQRAKHVPLAYVRGHTEFYGRDFVITPAVLEPRPESEAMIDLLKELPNLPTQPCLADVGTGSGALGITSALELPGSQVDLLEIDTKALEVAKINVDKFTLKLQVIESDLLSQSKAVYDVLLCNLPYVPDDYQINRAVLHEPRIALFGGPDGLNVYRKLFKQVEKRSKQPLFILTESLPIQHKSLVAIALESDYKLFKINDFIQVFIRTN
ncbi:hypothetical protein COY17_01125 [Candidatus Saccharibacteria bacterium CG_4_10_14_0_2_um_filter_52_9]|nr:MAG: hypothetical protein COY17_01125 [Candidatus Saccharibacteria bacterium CG_4_10_14_0_2_um_filter_52_9]